MKRGGPLRRTELHRHTAMRRTTTPHLVLAVERNRNPIRAVSPARTAMMRQRRAAEALLFAADPRCAYCKKADVELHGHERLSRAQGGDPARPDCLACNVCNTAFEDHPQVYAWWGWKKSKKHPRAPWLADNEAQDINSDIYTFPTIIEETA